MMLPEKLPSIRMNSRAQSRGAMESSKAIRFPRWSAVGLQASVSALILVLVSLAIARDVHRFAKPELVVWIVLLMFIELITLLITKPLSLCVRLFDNMFAGHLLLITFAVISATLFAVQWQIVILPFSGFLLIALTGFEVLVAFLQAFIFTILTAVYIGQSMHPEH